MEIDLQRKVMSNTILFKIDLIVWKLCEQYYQMVDQLRLK